MSKYVASMSLRIYHPITGKIQRDSSGFPSCVLALITSNGNVLDVCLVQRA